MKYEIKISQKNQYGTMDIDGETKSTEDLFRLIELVMLMFKETKVSVVVRNTNEESEE